MTKHVKQPAWQRPDPNKHPHPLSVRQKESAKEWARNHHVPYPSLVANFHAKKK